MLISEQMATELSAESAMTRSLLTKIPDDKLTWKAADGCQSIGWNATHLVEILGWVPGILCASEFDIAPIDGEPYVPKVAEHTSELLAGFDEALQGALEALKGVPDSVMDEPWSLKMGGQVLFTMAKGACLRKWVFSHTAHHRGILTAYLRLAGIQFPSVYEE